MNKMLLTKGDQDGQISPEYFRKVYFRGNLIMENGKSLMSEAEEEYEYLCVLDFEAQCSN